MEDILKDYFYLPKTRGEVNTKPFASKRQAVRDAQNDLAKRRMDAIRANVQTGETLAECKERLYAEGNYPMQ